MNHITKTSMLTGRVVEMDLRSDRFADERFLTMLSAALGADKFRIEITYETPNGEMQALAMVSHDENGDPHFGEGFNV